MRDRLFLAGFLAANLALLGYGLLALIMPSILLQTFSEHVYQFPPEAVRPLVYLSALYRLLGFFNIILGILGLLLLGRYRRTRQPWILPILILSTALAYVGPIVFDNTVGTVGFFEIVEHILFMLVIVLGLLMLRDLQPH